MRPSEQSIVLILSYQWRRLQRRPYRVRLRSQYSSGATSGSLLGGQTIVTLSRGRIPWQNLLIQSPWRRGRQDTTAILVRKQSESWRRTGANFLLFLQTLSLWFPRMTIWDFARRGRSFLSFLMVKTQITGMVRGGPFSHRARYSPRVIFLYVSSSWIPRFSSRKLLSQISQSEWESASALRREGGQSRWRLMALTNNAMGSNVVGVLEDVERRKEWEMWSGTRIPSTHRSAVPSCHYVDREGSHIHVWVCTLTNTLYTIL